jgi:hypothetical protein
MAVGATLNLLRAATDRQQRDVMVARGTTWPQRVMNTAILAKSTNNSPLE